AIGVLNGGFPADAVNVALEISRGRLEDIASYAVAEIGFPLPERTLCLRLDHHYAHAATAALTSPFEESAVLVCDHHSPQPLTFWRANGTRVDRIDRPWTGPGIPHVYSRVAAVFGFVPGREEHRLEALARI